MNVVKPYAIMLNVPDRVAGIVMLKQIEWCGRISHRSEEAQTDNSWEKFINAVVIQHGDWSIVEHVSVTCDFYVDRGITHELVRHRLFAFTQESSRFVSYEKKMPASFIQPDFGEDPDFHKLVTWKSIIIACETTYKELIGHGCAPQIARSVFPNALGSRIVITGNLRNWRHFFIMRTTKEAHPQMREVTIPLLKEFQEKIPILYDDIIPMAKQSESMKKGR